MQEENYTLEQILGIFKARIIDLEKFDSIELSELSGKERARAKVGKDNLALNRRLLATHTGKFGEVN